MRIVVLLRFTAIAHLRWPRHHGTSTPSEAVAPPRDRPPRAERAAHPGKRLPGDRPPILETATSRRSHWPPLLSHKPQNSPVQRLASASRSVITKGFILAKDFNRIGAKILRDHALESKTWPYSSDNSKM